MENHRVVFLNFRGNPVLFWKKMYKYIFGIFKLFLTIYFQCRYMSLPNLKQKCVTTSETAKKTFPRIDPGKVCAITEKSSVYSAVAQ